MLRPCPKDPPIKDPALLKRMRELITWCENPGHDQSWTGTYDPWLARHLDPQHIQRRGLGGSKRKDTPENVVILCRRCHTMIDHGGQRTEWVKRMREWVAARPPWLQRELGQCQ